MPSNVLGTEWTKGPLNLNAEVSAMIRAVKRGLTGTIKVSGQFASRLKATAQQNPRDGETVFRWAVAAVLQLDRSNEAGNAYWDYGASSANGTNLPWMLATSRRFGGYEYMRFRYLAEAKVSFAPNLMPLGRRLLAKDRNDELVAETMVYQLSGSPNPRDLDEGLKRVDGLLARYPKSLTCIGLKAAVFLSRYQKLGERPEDARNCLEWAQRCAAVAPPNSDTGYDGRRLVEAMSADMEKLGGKLGPASMERWRGAVIRPPMELTSRMTDF